MLRKYFEKIVGWMDKLSIKHKKSFPTFSYNSIGSCMDLEGRRDNKFGGMN